MARIEPCPASSSASSELYMDPLASFDEALSHNRNIFLRIFDFCASAVRWLKAKAFAISCIIFILMDVMTTVFYKRFIDHTRNYVMFSLQVIIFTFWCVIAFLAMLCFLFKRNYMTRPFDPKPLFFLGFLDMLSTGLSANGSTHTSGLILVLLGQISVPLTMVACKAFLSKKYHAYQYVSSAIILVFAIMKPVINRTDTTDNRLYNNVLYLASLVPDAIASALREKQYTSKFFHVIKYQFYGFTYHFFYNIVYTLATALPYTGIRDFFGGLVDLYVNGFKCIFHGVNTVVDNCGPSLANTCDNCGEALKIFLLYIAFSSAIRIAYVFIMLDGSVTFTLLLGTVKVPLTSIAFTLHFIAGDSTTTLNFVDVVCFFGIVLGLLLYVLGSKKMQEQAGLLETPLLEDPEDEELGPLVRGANHLMQSEAHNERLA